MSEKITSSGPEYSLAESAKPEPDRTESSAPERSSITSLPTPFFLVRESLLAENIGGFRRALDQLWPNSRIAYSVKTNALPWILRWMLSHGVDAEVVSDQEYELARLCGFPPQRIVFNGPVKGRETLRAALEGGATVNLDSASDLDTVIDRFADSEQHSVSVRNLPNAEAPNPGYDPAFSGMLGLRLNVDPALFDPCDVGYQEDGFRFGYSEETGAFASALDRLSAVMDIRQIGLHVHVNSVTRSPRVYAAAAAFAARIIQKYGLTPAYVDIGGGFFGGVPGKTTPEEYISVIREALLPAVNPSRTALILEPGSAAVGSAVELHTSVLDVKDTVHARIVTTDGSRIHIDPLWLKKSYLFTTDADRPPCSRQVVCGYTCMDHDRLMVIENQPELAPGHRIVYHRVGNYTVTFGGPFIRPFPPVYAEAADGSLSLVRREMTMREYFRMETAEE